MEIKDIAIGLIVIGLSCLSIILLITGFNNQYNNDELNITKLNTILSYSNETNQIISDMQDNSLGTGNIDEQIGFYSFSKKIWQGIKNIIKTPKILYNILYYSLEDYNLGWVVSYLILIFLSLLIFLLIYFFWRYRV